MSMLGSFFILSVFIMFNIGIRTTEQCNYSDSKVSTLYKCNERMKEPKIKESNANIG